MDLPPPPPLPLFRHHFRYGSVLHPPDFVPPPYAPNLAPPPPPRPPSYAFHPPPPPLSPPMGYIGLPPISPSFAFSPPNQSIIDRRRLYEFDPINKPYIHNEVLPPRHRLLPPPPPPPPPPRENIPFRFIHERPERNRILNDEVFGRGCNDDYRRVVPGNYGRDLRFGADEFRGGVLDIGGHERSRYRDSFYQRDDLCDNREYGERRLGNRISDWRSDLNIKRDYEERGCDGGINDWGRDLYRSDYDNRMCDGGITDRVQPLCNERRDYDGRRWNNDVGERLSDERRWNTGISVQSNEMDYDERRRNNEIDWGLALSDERDYDERRCNNGIDWGRALPNESDNDERGWNGVIGDQGRVMCHETDHDVRRNNGIDDRGCKLHCDWDDERRSNFVGSSCNRTSLELENIQPENLEDAFSLARSGDWSPSSVSRREVMDTKRRRLLKSHRIQSGKAFNWNSGGHKSHHLSKNSSNRPFKGKEKQGFEQLQTRLEDKIEREQSPVELDISFKSNSLIGKAISVSSHSDVKTEMDTKNIEASDSRGVLKERLDEVTVSGSGGAYARDVKCPNKKFVQNEVHRDKISPGLITPGRAQFRQSRKRKRARQRHQHQANRKMSKSCNNIIKSNNCINSHFLTPHPSLDYSVLEENTSSEFVDMGSDATLLSSSGCVISKRIGGDLDSCKPSVSNLKRKSSSLTTLSDSLCEANLLITKSSGQGESLAISTNDACQHTNNFCKFFHNKAPVLDTETREINSIDRVDNFYAHPLQNGLLSGNDLGMEIESCDMFGLSQAYENRNPELQESGSPLLQKTKNVAISGVGSKDANLKFSTNHINLGGAVIANSSNVSLGIPESTLAAGHTDNIAQLDVSLDDTRKNSFFDGASVSHIIDSAEGSPQTMSHVKSGFSPDCTSRINRKRKVRNAQMVVVDPGSARCSAKGLAPTVGAEFPDVKDSSKGDNGFSVWASGVEDLNCGANGSYRGSWKKRKVVSSRSNPSPLSEDDTVADGLDDDSVKVAQWSTAVCDPTDMEGQVGSENITNTGTDEALADSYKLPVKDDEIVPVVENPSLSADRNCDSASNSGDELLATGTFVRSCLSSPEGMPLYSDMSFLSDNKLSGFLSENEMTSRKGVYISKPSNNFFSAKSLKKAASENLQMKTRILPPLPQNKNKVMKELNLVQGRLPPSKNQLTSAVPKVFPGHHAINFGNSRKFSSTCVTKSRTWHRPDDNSLATAKESEAKSSLLPQSSGTKTTRNIQNSYVRKGNSLVRKASPCGVTPPGLHGLRSTVYRLTTCTDSLKNDQASNTKTGNTDNSTLQRIDDGNVTVVPKALPDKHGWQSLNESTTNLSVSLPAGSAPKNSCLKSPHALEETSKSSAVPEGQTGSVNNADSERTLEEDTSMKKIMYVKRKSNQLVAASSSDDGNVLSVDKTRTSSGSYYKNRNNQLVRATSEELQKKGLPNAKARGLLSHEFLPRTSSRRPTSFAKTCRSSKFSLVWKLHDTQCSEKHNNSLGPQKVWPRLFTRKSATRLRSFMHALSTKANSSFSCGSLKLLLSRKRGAVYTRSIHGYSLKMSKVLSVSGSSLKWSKSIEKNSKKASEDATRAVAAAQKRKKEEKNKFPDASKGRTHVSRERIFRIGSERYRMDPTRRSLHRIAAEEDPASSVVQSENTQKRSYVPRRLLIGNNEYVRIGNGNQLVRDPKKRTRILASEKVRWSLRTARLRLARKRKYCQFFTRFGKCNKDDGKCPYIHDPSKIAVCTKFLRGSCSNTDCKLTHKVIPERMQDCSYFSKGLCSNENCPYRHVNVNPDSAVCENFLRGYCAEGNECPKKHSYVCPAFEAMGSCPQASTCKLHHPKRKEERKPPPSEQKSIRGGGRYFDGGLADDWNAAPTEKLSTKGNDKGTFPDYISLEVSDEETD